MTKKTNKFKSLISTQETGPSIRGSVFIYNQKNYIFGSSFLILLLFFFSCERRGTHQIDSEASNFFSEIEDKYYLYPEKRDSLREAIFVVSNDSLKKEFFFKLSYHFYTKNDSLEFRYWNNKTFAISRKMQDTLHLAESHWDLGNFLKRNEEIDSSFYHYQIASSFYKIAGDDFFSARMMLNMGILQQNVKDYTGSEITTSKAISIIKPLGEHFQLYIGYNSLGISFNELEEYDRALSYHGKAYNAALKLSNPMLKANTLNNIGVVHKNSGDYSKAIKYYKAGLEVDSLPEKNIRLYAMLNDNIAYARMKAKRGLNIENQLLFALHVRDSINHRSGIVTNKIHLGEFYAEKGDSIKSIKYLSEANSLAEEENYYRDYLKSLLLLSKIDKRNSEEYLSAYILLDDSLQREERNIRNKFGRIRFETDEFIAENQLLTEQRKWVLGGSAGVILVVVLLFVIRNQKINNKRLQLEQAQQKANEDIYNLLLEQENKIEEGRSREKERISRDLHDGVLSKMFGTRFVLGSLIGKADEPSLLKKKNLLNELRLIEEEIRNISHNLGNGNLPDQVGFLAIVQKLLEEQKKITNFKPLVIADENLKWEKITNRIKINLYRIIQEAVQNINKYADATEVKVSFERVKDRLRVIISDNGNGFEVEKKSQGIGLKNMKSRAKDLYGTLEISSGKKGTEIIIEIPTNYGGKIKGFNG